MPVRTGKQTGLLILGILKLLGGLGVFILGLIFVAGGMMDDFREVVEGDTEYYKTAFRIFFGGVIAYSLGGIVHGVLDIRASLLTKHKIQ